MSETVESRGNSIVWTAENMVNDLRDQGKLVCSSLTIGAIIGGIDYIGLLNMSKPFNVSWVINRLLMVSMGTQFYDQALIDAFSLVLGYPPFIRYQQTQGGITLQTTEWTKGDYKKTWMEIRSLPGFHHVELLVNPNDD